MTAIYPTYWNTYKGDILLRGFKDGKPFMTKQKLKPVLYRRGGDENSEFKTMKGEPLIPVEFDSTNHQYKFQETHGNVENMKFYGVKNAAQDYINRTFAQNYSGDFDHLQIGFIDIETTVGEYSNGFPEPKLAAEMITLITIYDKNFKRTKTFSCRPYNGDEEFDYEYYKNEETMLREFIRYWKSLNLDIYSGWRCRLFDMPYLCNRIAKVLGEEFVDELSPFGIVRMREEKSEWDEDETNIYFDVYGIACLDLMELYKKFILKKEESYKLDHISTVVLGVGKLEMPYPSFRDNYQKAWDTHFVKYNRIDVIRCVEIDDKLNLINLAFTLSQVMRSNLEDVFSPVRYWENLLVSTLFFDKKLVCIDGEKGPSYPYEGGYVMTPKPGLYRWACSVDATSEYPSIMMASNLSTETFVGMFKPAHFNTWAIAHGYGPIDENTKINVELVLNQGIAGLGEYLKSLNYAMLANGAMFRKDTVGFIARETEKVFDGRKVAKKEMLKYKGKKDPENLKNYAKYDTIQSAFKVAGNSLYGATANDWFFLQDSRLSEGITLTGQCMVRYAGDGIDKWYQELFGCNSRFYTDTDSVLFSLDEIVKKYMAGVDDKIKITNGLIKVIDAKIQPILNASMASLSDYLNLDATRLSFKREFVADRALMIAKKMYMTRVYNNEGVEYPEGDLKVMGITVVRSSTPQIVRTHLSDMLPMLLDEDISKIQNHIEKTREIYMNAKPEEIAFPRGVKDIAKWETPQGPKKGCPIHVRASIVHNMMVKNKSLENDVPYINPGDKMKFVYTVLPNPSKQNVIGFIDKLPKEFEMEKYIDYGTMWEKSFMKPVEDFLAAAGVVIPDAADITSFFG